MKNIVFLFLVILFAGPVAAQVPQNINYQAVARNNNGQALANQTIKTRLSIMSGATSLYSETRSVTTNGLGLFNVRIGSPGTISTSGSFTTINWTSNQPEVKLIKVELDINNTNVFTDMGSQTLATVPYAFSASEAINAINIGGRYVDTNTPQPNDILKWDGNAWAPAALPAQPTVGNVGGIIAAIPFGGASAPWVFAGPTATVTINGPQDVIIATATGVFGHTNTNPQPCSFAMCWSDVPAGSPVTTFMGTNYLQATVGATPNRTNLTATGTITNLPAGSYKIGFGLKNNSTTVNYGANDFMNMSYQIIRN